MKLTNKLLTVAATTVMAAAVMFTGCGLNLGSGDITLTEGGAAATINAKNESTTDYRRSVSKVVIPKKEMASVITFENQTAASNDGILGLVFDVHASIIDEKDPETGAAITSVSKDESDFGVVALSYQDNTLRTYVSYYKRVGNDYMATSATNFCDNAGVQIDTAGCLASEVRIEPTSPSWNTAALKTIKVDEKTGKVSVYVSIKGNDDGSFTVKYFPTKAASKEADAVPLFETTVASEYTTISKDKAVTFGYYSNVYRAVNEETPTKLKGSWASDF